MSLTVPLAVRLSTARQDRHVTADVRDLSFRSVVPGGFASASIALDRPLRIEPDEVQAYGRLYVYDARNGAVVWEGRLEVPGKSRGDDGEVWAISAVGPSAHVRDTSVPIIYVDHNHSSWVHTLGVSGGPFAETPAGRMETGEDPGGSGFQSLTLSAPPRTPVIANTTITAHYPRLQDCGQELAMLLISWDNGRTDALWRVQTYSAGANQLTDTGFTTAGVTTGNMYVTTNWTLGDDLPFIQLKWIGGINNVGDSDTAWASFLNLCVRGILYNADGTKKSTGYASEPGTSVRAHNVVADLLGRVLSEYDGANATIVTTSYDVYQCTYYDPATPEKILEDMMAFEPTTYWAAWESNAAGKHRFEYTTWPTVVGYEARPEHRFSSSGGVVDLFDSVRVRYRGETGRTHTVVRTQTVPELTAAGKSRQAFVDLGDELGSLDNAQQVGDAFLAEHLAPSNSGTLTVDGPIVDMLTGRMIQPWEIRPGRLIRVPGVVPSVDSLNATDRDGASVFRVAAVDFRASTATADLDLDSYSPSLAAALAKLAKRTPTRRR